MRSGGDQELPMAEKPEGVPRAASFDYGRVKRAKEEKVSSCRRGGRKGGCATAVLTRNWGSSTGQGLSAERFKPGSVRQRKVKTKNDEYAAVKHESGSARDGGTGRLRGANAKNFAKQERKETSPGLQEGAGEQLKKKRLSTTDIALGLDRLARKQVEQNS